jgi:hypothetical protein
VNGRVLSAVRRVEDLHDPLTRVHKRVRLERCRPPGGQVLFRPAELVAKISERGLQTGPHEFWLGHPRADEQVGPEKTRSDPDRYIVGEHQLAACDHPSHLDLRPDTPQHAVSRMTSLRQRLYRSGERFGLETSFLSAGEAVAHYLIRRVVSFLINSGQQSTNWQWQGVLHNPPYLPKSTSCGGNVLSTWIDAANYRSPP